MTKAELDFWSGSLKENLLDWRSALLHMVRKLNYMAENPKSDKELLQEALDGVPGLEVLHDSETVPDRLAEKVKSLTALSMIPRAAATVIWIDSVLPLFDRYADSPDAEAFINTVRDIYNQYHGLWKQQMG